MGKQSDLEKIADLLLEGRIDVAEAEDLAKRARIKQTFSRESSDEYKIEENETLLQLMDKKGQRKAFIEFYTETNELNDTFIWLKLAISQQINIGYFSKLYKKLEEVARNKGAAYISLDVDRHNDDAINIYYHYGFVNVGEFEAENREMILMRKYLE
ncbi:MAG: GNAT family N-acetyltransferase [archaeon]|nr:GNAT family N-acetyltransferase [archaeon]